MPTREPTVPFPPELPSSLTHTDVIVEHDQRAFDQLAQMTSHWDRPGWRPETRRYYWYLTASHIPELVQQASAHQKALAHLDFDAVPPEGLHVTIARVAETNQLPDGQLNRLLKNAAQRCRALPAFDAQAVPMSGSRGAIRYSLAPWKPLWDLHAAVTAAGEDEGFSAEPTRHLRPHLCIAYNNRQRDAAPVQQAVSALRSAPPIKMPVRDVQLVELSRSKNAYHARTVHSVPLGTAGPQKP